MKKKLLFENNRRTFHGSSIADQIQGEDAYGYTGPLTASDVWNFLDQMQTHLLDTPELEGRPALEAVVTRWMCEIESLFPNMEI